jgi:copper chaperone NosL
MTKLIIGLLFILPVIFGGCSKSSDAIPPKIMAGQDPCDHCFMLINEVKYAAALTLKNGEEKRFDDIGCMLSYISENKANIKYYWVNDFNSGKTIPAEKAFFIESKNEVTPMGSGILAFGSEKKAAGFAAGETSSILRFNDLINNINKQTE